MSFGDYKALFFGDSQQDRNVATRAREWLEHDLRPTVDNITFRLPSRIHFPWGLIYDQPVTADIDTNQFKKNFWCEKYSATVHYAIPVARERCKAGRPPRPVHGCTDENGLNGEVREYGDDFGAKEQAKPSPKRVRI